MSKSDSTKTWEHGPVAPSTFIETPVKLQKKLLLHYYQLL